MEYCPYRLNGKFDKGGHPYFRNERGNPKRRNSSPSALSADDGYRPMPVVNLPSTRSGR